LDLLLTITFSTVPAHSIYSNPPFWIAFIDYTLTIAAIIAYSPFVYLTMLGKTLYEGKDYDHEKRNAFWFLILVIIFLINSVLAAVTCVDDYYKIGRGEIVFAENTGDTFLHLPRLMSVSEWVNHYRDDADVFWAKEAAEKGDFSQLRTGESFKINSEPATWVNFTASPTHFDSDSALKGSVIEFLSLIVVNAVWGVVSTVFFPVAAFVLIFLSVIIIRGRLDRRFH
jgi:hypothetical protein